jgi:hypothetical protein
MVGKVKVAVVHWRGSHWLFDAGPFLITVTGTRFTADWRESEGRLEVVLETGSIAVSGPLSDEAIALRAGQRLVIARSAPLRSVPVGIVNWWSRRVGLREDSAERATRCSLASSRSMTPPCSSPFGPSRLDWISRIGNTTSADSCSARVGFRQLVPSFQASPTDRSGGDTHAASAGLPGQERDVSLRKLVICLIWERLRDVVLTRLTDPALYNVSVRSLAALTRMLPVATPIEHSQRIISTSG